MKKIALIFTALLLAISPLAAQINVGKGTLSGSLETNNIFYNNDSKLNKPAPDDHFGSNNYLKVDYNIGRFSTGILAEGYLPAIQGYDPRLKGIGITSKYVQWQDVNFSFLAGDIYDQYGSGILFRSYEDRALGFNNSIEGVRGAYNFNDYVRIKAMWGRPRLFMGHANSQVRGADLSISLSEITRWNNANLELEGSFINRYESLADNENFDLGEMGMKPNVNMYSGRINMDFKGFTLRGEYVAKGNDLQTSGEVTVEKGEAILGELCYTYKGFSILATGRKLKYMTTPLTIDGTLSIMNNLNYLPSLTRQYTYMLANLNPYIVHSDNELGVQADIFYSYRNPRNRSKHINFHVNYSTAYSNQGDGNELVWRDINFDIECQFNRSFKGGFLFSRQTRDAYIDNSPLFTDYIFVADATYKFDKKNSLRAELQYLYSQYGEGDWVAALLEFSMAPQWSFFVSDMYNIDETKVHYYNAGASYTKSRTRVQLAYGRVREGYICSGGVCRLTPSYMGINFLITTSF